MSQKPGTTSVDNDDSDFESPAAKRISYTVTKTSDDEPEFESPGPKGTSPQLANVSIGGDDIEASDTIVVRPRHPTLPTYNTLATAHSNVEKAMLSLRAAECEISQSFLNFKEEKRQFSKDKSAINAREEAVKRNAKAKQELRDRVSERESDVEQLESRVKARETAVENLELELKVREEAIGTLETSKEESNVTKEKEEIKAEQAKLATFRSDLEKEKSSLGDMRSAWKNEQESSNKALEKREDALAKRKTSIEEMDQRLKKRKDDILKREEDFNVKQQTLNALDTLSSLTDAQVMEFIQKNPIAQRIIRNNISKRVTKETETFKTEHAKEIKELLEEREQRLKQREDEFAKKEAALTSVHPNTPIRLAAPATASQGTPQLLGQFGLVIPLRLLAKNCSFEEQYRLIPAGMPNAGMYMRQSGSRELTLDGKLFRAERFLKEYTVNQIVTNPTIAVDGVKLDKITQHGGYEWENYVKDDKSKLVQKFSTKSCVFDRSRVFVSWHVYKQIEDVPDFTI